MAALATIRPAAPQRITEEDADWQHLHAATVRRLDASLRRYVRDLRTASQPDLIVSGFIARHTQTLRDAYTAGHQHGVRDYYQTVSLERAPHVEPDQDRMAQRLTFYAPSVAKMAREGLEAERARRHAGGAQALSEAVTLADDPTAQWYRGLTVRVDLQANLGWAGMQDGYAAGGADDPARPFEHLWWTLGSVRTEHCQTCIELALESPYDPPGSGGHELYQTPADGRTDCGAGCKCSLEYGAGDLPNALAWVTRLPATMKAQWPAGSEPGLLLPAHDGDLSRDQKRALDAFRRAQAEWDQARGALPPLPDMFGWGVPGDEVSEALGRLNPIPPQIIAAWEAMVAWQEATYLANGDAIAAFREDENAATIALFNPNHDPSSGRFGVGEGLGHESEHEGEDGAHFHNTGGGGGGGGSTGAVRDLRARITATEREIVHSPHEIAVVWSRDGHIISRDEGGERSTTLRLPRAAYKDAIYTHNHPVERGFSPQDVQSFAHGKMAEMRAVTRQYRYSLRPPREGWGHVNWVDHIYPSFRRQLNDARVELHVPRYLDNMSDDAYETELAHRVWTRVAQDTGLRYRRARWNPGADGGTGLSEDAGNESVKLFNPNHDSRGRFAPGEGGLHGESQHEHEAGSGHGGGVAEHLAAGHHAGAGGGGGSAGESRFADATPFTHDEFVAGLAGRQRFKGGVNPIYHVQINGQHYVAKEVTPTDVRNERAAREVAKVVGLGEHTVPIYHEEHEGYHFLLSPHVEGYDTERAWKETGQEPGDLFHQAPQELRNRMLLHAYVTGDGDRNTGNYYWDTAHGRLLSIDHGVAFDRHGASFRHYELSPFMQEGIQHFDHGMDAWRGVRLDHATIRAFTDYQAELEQIARHYGHSVSDIESRLAVLRQLDQLPEPTLGNLASIAK